MLENINTKRGDDGYTDLYFGGQVKKNSWPVKIGGHISMFNAMIGRCRRFLDIDSAIDLKIITCLHQIQTDLVNIMGEIYTDPKNLNLYYNKKRPLSQDDVETIEKFIQGFGQWLDEEGYVVSGWITYGSEGVAAAEFDFCSEFCRIIEPLIYDAEDAGFTVRKDIKIYMNRMSKLFYILARVLGHENKRGTRR